MALIICPECGKRISDKAAACPNCGLPAKFFHSIKEEKNLVMETTSSYVPDVPRDINLQNIGNILVSFDKDYILYFNPNHYISTREKQELKVVYGGYYKYLKAKMVFDYVCNHAKILRVDIDALKRFLIHMHHLDNDVEVHNSTFVNQKLEQEKDYFDHILEKIDPHINLDEEQRRAVITDDDYCLLVAGAGAGKTTTVIAPDFCRGAAGVA